MSESEGINKSNWSDTSGWCKHIMQTDVPRKIILGFNRRWDWWTCPSLYWNRWRVLQQHEQDGQLCCGRTWNRRHVFHSLSSSWPLCTFLHLPHNVWGGARFKQAPKRFCLLLPDWEQVVTWVKSSSVFWRASVEWFPELWVPLHRFWESSNLQRVPLVFWSCLAWMWWNWPHRSVHRHWFSMKSLKKKKKKN